MTDRFDARDLARAVSAGILNPGQDQALLEFLRLQAAPKGSFQLAHVAFYFGAVLIMGAMGWLLNEAWTSLGDGALLTITLLYISTLTALALTLQRRQQPIAAGALATVAVSIVPLAVYALQQLTDFWPFDDTPADAYPAYYRYVQGQWLVMEAATVVAGLLMLRLVPFPFIVMPIALALWFMSMDITERLYGSNFAWEQRNTVSMAFGAVMLSTFLVIDGRTRGDYAGWGYLAGLLALSSGLMALYDGTSLEKVGYCLINLALMALAVVLRRPMFMVFGAFGVAAYLSDLAYHVFAQSLLFPLVITGIGLSVITLGLIYQKRRERMSQALRQRTPRWLQQALPALRR